MQFSRWAKERHRETVVEKSQRSNVLLQRIEYAFIAQCPPQSSAGFLRQRTNVTAEREVSPSLSAHDLVNNPDEGFKNPRSGREAEAIINQPYPYELGQYIVDITRLTEAALLQWGNEPLPDTLVPL